MTGLRLDIANPNAYTPKEYVEKVLAPAATELHRIINELVSPGATSAEEWGVDMVPETASAVWQHLDTLREQVGKHVVFDGAEYFTLPKELLRAKQLKVQLTATVYVIADHASLEDPSVGFRLVDEGGTVITGSSFRTSSRAPATISLTLPFGEPTGCVQPAKRTYYIEGCGSQRGVWPVCRRLSMSFIYI